MRLSYALGMRRRDALLKSVVQSSTDCIVCIDEAGIIKTANPAASRLFGCAIYELIDEPIAKFITLLAGDGAGARLGALHGEIRECDARTLTGEVFPVEISVSRVRLNTERLYTAIVRDIRDRRAQQRRLQHQATHDSLTGLPNRAALLAHLETALGLQPVRPALALLMLDLCRFKEVNDTLGHNVGDWVLCNVAQRFAEALGDRGFIARIGGDEFTVVLAAPEREAVATTAQLLADCLRAPIDVAGISIEVGVSIGVAHYPDDAGDAHTLLRHADVAMYVSKRRGATFEYYDAAHDENTVRKLAIGGELRAAIASNALELHFQPQVNLRSGMVESAEALLRWFHPTQGAIGPNEFIAIAEATDLIRPLTEWTLNRCADADTHLARSRRARTHRGESLRAAAAGHGFSGAAAKTARRVRRVAASSLELEITESAMMLDPARALARDPGNRPVRGTHFHRRLRHRIFIARLPARPAGALAQARQVVRHGNAQQLRRSRDRRVDRADGACAQAGARGRRRRNRMGRPVSDRGRLRLCAGLSLLPDRCRPTSAWRGSWNSTPRPCSPSEKRT